MEMLCLACATSPSWRFSLSLANLFRAGIPLALTPWNHCVHPRSASSGSLSPKSLDISSFIAWQRAMSLWPSRIEPRLRASSEERLRPLERRTLLAPLTVEYRRLSSTASDLIQPHCTKHVPAELGLHVVAVVDYLGVGQILFHQHVVGCVHVHRNRLHLRSCSQHD